MKLRKRATWLLVLAYIFLAGFGLGMADEVVEYKAIDQITDDIRTPAKRSAALAELSAIVTDSTRNARLRYCAAEKLGALGAVEAKGALKGLAEKLEWTDDTRMLKWVCYLAYWQVSVAEQPSRPKKIKLLRQALFDWFENLIASNVQTWAADELANMGVKEALPEIVKSVRDRDPTESGEEQIRLCQTKIDLLTTSASRYEALTKALVMQDTFRYMRLRRWAIEEMGKLNTQDARLTLLAYALKLQDTYYDENGKAKGTAEDRRSQNPAHFYNMIVKILKKQGMTDEQLKDAGLRPRKYFRTI